MPYPRLRHVFVTGPNRPLAGPAGRRLKRALLNALEECAAERGVRLVPEFFALRGRVINDEG